jgi:hypothetical protein
MKRIWLIPLTAAGVWLSATAFVAAQTPDQKATENPATTTQHRSNTGTAPENMGASGWTGGRKDSAPTADTTGAAPSASDSASGGTNINDDSVYATGEDLKGPTAHFLPASRTPE